MIKSPCLSLVLIILSGLLSSWNVDDRDTRERAYIEEHQSFARDEMRLNHIPASITLAQALVESDAGQSILAVRANNHFGIKCKSWWTGGTYYYADDDLDQRGDLTASCFRRYDSVHASFADHSAFLRFSGRYDQLFDFALTDYTSWAKGLQRCGYATDTGYAQRLIRIIEKYQLQEFDRE